MTHDQFTDTVKDKATLALKKLDSIESDLIDIPWVAAYLDVGQQFVRKLIGQGELETVRVAPKKTLVYVSSLRAFLERRKNTGRDSRFIPKNWNGGRREGNQYTG